MHVRSRVKQGNLHDKDIINNGSRPYRMRKKQKLRLPSNTCPSLQGPQLASPRRVSSGTLQRCNEDNTCGLTVFEFKVWQDDKDWKGWCKRHFRTLGLWCSWAVLNQTLNVQNFQQASTSPAHVQCTICTTALSCTSCKTPGQPHSPSS